MGRAAANVLSLLASGRYVASRSSVKMIGMEINGMNLLEVLGANNYVSRCLAFVVVFEDGNGMDQICIIKSVDLHFSGPD